ncbi:hypothetical protein [Paraburkholderia sp. 2C]|jgi:hypothetical protein
MTQLRSLLIGSTIAALATTAAVAQTSNTPPNAPATAPAAQGVQMPAPAGTPPPRQTLTAPTPPDPLVQKRDADARANAEYRDAKKASKAQYQEQVNNAKNNRAADRQAAANQLKTDLQSGNGTQVPDDETKH